MDLDLWDCFGRKNLCLIIEEIRYNILQPMVISENRYLIQFLFVVYDQCRLISMSVLELPLTALHIVSFVMCKAHNYVTILRKHSQQGDDG